MNELKLPKINVGYSQRSVPAIFDDSMSYLEILYKLANNVNHITEHWNEFVDYAVKEGFIDKLNEWLEDGTFSDLINNQVYGDILEQIEDLRSRFTSIGDAVETLGSLYVPNDHNLFGRKKDGSYMNIGTVQQNDILQYGDEATRTMWLVAMGYHSLRSPSSPSYQKIDEDGDPVGPGRTILHQGNTGGHLVVFSVGEHPLKKNEYIEMHTLTNVNGCYPPDSYNNFYYKVPRAGMYFFNPIVKLRDEPPARGYLRFGLRIMRANGTVTNSDMADVLYDPDVYGTPFISSSFGYRLSTGDQVQVIVKPINHEIVLDEGTKLYLYQLGDTIQE